MTRCNLVPPSELADQHLFAEWRELKMFPKSLARSLRARGLQGVLDIIPAEYTLGKGHVSFFYNKGAYLSTRYIALTAELRKRGVNFDIASTFDPGHVFALNSSLFGPYCPTEAALVVIRTRIAEKIAMKPEWYRWTRVL